MSEPFGPRPDGSPDPGAAFLLSLLAGEVRVPPGVDWTDATRLLRRHGMHGLAVAAHRRSAFLPPEVAEELEPAYLLAALHSTLTREAALRARKSLARAGVPCLLYKGVALLEDGTYVDPGSRRMDDADLLVPPERADEAVRRLSRAGFRTWAPWDPGRVRWLDSVCLTDLEAPRTEGRVTLDLHWRVQYGSLRFGEREGPEVLWEGADRERGLPAPGPHFLVLAEHLLKHLRVLVHLRGLADLVRVSRRIADWGPLVEAARRRSAGAYGALFDVLAGELGAPVPGEARRLGEGSRSRRVARRVLDPGRLIRDGSPGKGRVRGLVLRWILAGSLRAAAGEVVRTALPGARWLRARYGSARASLPRLHLRYWGDLLRWAVGSGRSPVSPNQELLE